MICLKEVLLADKMHKLKKSAVDIRKAIIRGDWEDIELK